LIASPPASEIERLFLLSGLVDLPSKVFLRLELPLGATPLSNFLESLEVKLTNIAEFVPGIRGELLETFRLVFDGVESGEELFLIDLMFDLPSGVGVVAGVCQRLLLNWLVTLLLF
jgi:hypothetical protein